jgi:hypothetical protein
MYFHSGSMSGTMLQFPALRFSGVPDFGTWKKGPSQPSHVQLLPFTRFVRYVASCLLHFPLLLVTLQ